jgi:murein DD-endopeptidase MepM/ murein hydrolase activator NlpD
MKIALPLLLFLSASPAQAAYPATDPIADEVVHALVDGRYDAAAARLHPSTRQKIGPRELASVLDPLRAQRGPAREIRIVPHSGYADVFVDVTWTRGEPSQLELAFADDGAIIAIMVRDRPTAEREAKTKLRLPFRGTWSAMNAERNMSNPHFNNPNQTYAVDWIVRDEQLKSFKTDGKRNEDYYAYGKEALAPADGVVVIVVDGVPENPAPRTDEGDKYNVCGNHVVVDFGNGEYALLAHLIPGSIRVKVGEHVTAGQTLGLVGNSGHSTEPHLHFQLMDAPRLTVAHSLPARYDDVLVNGKPVKRAWPSTGNRVSAVEPRK